MGNRSRPNDGLWITYDVGRSDFANEVRLHRLAAEHGLAPQIVEVGDNYFVSHHTGRPVVDVVRFWTLEQRIEVRDRIIRLLKSLADLGIHHRDASGLNVTIDGDGEVWLIDFEWAIEQGGCSYDLFGPEVSGVPVPTGHQAAGFTVWWHGTVRPLGDLFGPLPLL